MMGYFNSSECFETVWRGVIVKKCLPVLFYRAGAIKIDENMVHKLYNVYKKIFFFIFI